VELDTWYIVGMLLLVALQGVTIASLGLHRSRRRAIEARNRAMLRAAPDMMFLLTRDGVYVDYHAPDDNLLLLKPQQFVGRRFHDVLPPSLATLFEECFDRLASEPAPTIIEYPLDLGGEERHYEARLVPCGNDHVLSIVRDVTDRKRAEEALRKTQERYALATAAGSVGVWDWDLETNDLYIDPSLKAMLGYKDDDIANRLEDWTKIMHPDDVAAVLTNARDHIGDQSPFYEVEHRMVHADGSIRWFLTRGSAVRRGGGSVRIVGTETDITRRKESERALRETEAELFRVSRLTALGEFAAAIAHEVHQPLTAIALNARAGITVLERTEPDTLEIRGVLNDILEASAKAAEVIRRNRDLFRYHRVQKLPLDLNNLLLETLELTAARLESSDVRLATLVPTRLPLIAGDRIEIQQVLLNLIANSIDAMESIEPRMRAIRVVASAVPSQNVVQVSVSDNGVGLDAVDMQRIFKPFYTTKSNGTGIGLSLSHSIIDAHGGRLWAHPNRSGGATFTFTVPLYSTAPEADTSSVSAQSVSDENESGASITYH
jgi:PAS domain S-box-containing protein